MKRYRVTIKFFSECLEHSDYETQQEAEGVRDILEKHMPGAKVEVADLAKQTRKKGGEEE